VNGIEGLLDTTAATLACFILEGHKNSSFYLKSAGKSPLTQQKTVPMPVSLRSLIHSFE
jgi:hypothetical protein